MFKSYVACYGFVASILCSACAKIVHSTSAHTCRQVSQETIESFDLLHYCSVTRFVMCRRMLSCWRHVGDVAVDRHDKFSDLAGCDWLTAAFLRRSSLNRQRAGRGTSRTVVGHRVHNYHHYIPDFQTDAAAAIKPLVLYPARSLAENLYMAERCNVHT